MKRIIALILALVMTMALVACGGDKPTSSTPTDPSSPTQSSKPTEPGNPAASTPAEKPAEDPDAWKYGGDLVIGTANQPTIIDPHQNNGTLGNVYLALHVYESFGIQDHNGKFYGQVFDVEESADGLTVKCTLRDRQFSNGDKITIEDARASFERAVALQTESGYDKVWKDVTVTWEGNTVTFTMPVYNINFLSSLCSTSSYYKIMPKEICDKYPVTGGEVQPNGLIKAGTANKIDDVKDVIGSGPYMLTSFTDFESVMSRNENYEVINNEDALGVAAPAKQYMDTITIKVNTDAGSRTAATMAGDYHIGSVSSEMRETAKTMGVKFADAGTTWTHGIFFNLSPENAGSPVEDVNVRKAIRACLDLDAIMLSVVGGDQSRIKDLEPYAVVKESAAYASTKMEDSGEWNIKDQAKAKEYLAKSNYKGEEIVYLVNSGGGAFYKAAMAAIPSMEAIGLKVNLWVVDTGSHGATRKDPGAGHDIGCWEVQKRTDNPVLHSTFVTGSQGWWSSPAKDAAIATMKSTPTGSPESVKAYNDYLDAVIDECPYILFGHPMGLLAVRENVEVNTVGQVNYYYWNTYFNDNKK